jgi:hypothetical protein
MQETSGLAKAQILYYLHKNWEKFGIQDDLIHISLQYGLKSPLVTKRYIDIWSMFEDGQIPNSVVERIKHKPINDITPIMGALKRGYVINDEQWEDLAQQEGNTDIADYIRVNIKKIQPRTHTILFKLNRDSHMLIATNQGKTYQVAKLNLESVDEITQIAIRRLLHAIGILE